MDQLDGSEVGEMPEGAHESAPDPVRPTVVVSIFGGPGSGKTTAALDITARLKKLGFLADFAPEYAKEVVWDTKAPLATPQQRAKAQELLNGGLQTQRVFFAQQVARVNRCLGQCDFVITDSPGLIGMVCLRPPFDAQGRDALYREMLADFASHQNFVMAMRRGEAYEAQGRIESPKRALAMDRATVELLDGLGEPWRTYGHEELGQAVSDIQRRLFAVRQGLGLPADPRGEGESREVLWLRVPATCLVASGERGWLVRLPQGSELCGIDVGGVVARVPLDVRAETLADGWVRLGVIPGTEAVLLGRDATEAAGAHADAGGRKGADVRAGDRGEADVRAVPGCEDGLRMDVSLLARVFSK